MSARRIVIMGAAGRDFHNFNVVFRDRDDARVVAFTATQIPDIADRRYPAVLAGPRYPDGIPIVAEERLEELAASGGFDEAVFSYSDVSHQHVMEQASRILALGADFRLLGADPTMLRSKHPVVAVCAVRTGSGKSQTTRRVAGALKEIGRRPVVVRHPMPYGELAAQRVQRFATLEDMRRQRCTLRALAAEVEPVTLALRFPQIARAVRESTTTNLPLSFLPDLIDYAAALDYGDIAAVVFGYPYYAPELDFRNLPMVDPERIRWKVQSALAAVETAAGAADLAEECEVLPAR